jgi:hypothetical protein
LQTSTKKCTYISTSFGNRKTAAEPISEEFEKYLLSSLIEELNHLFPVDLATDLICDRYIDSDVFDENIAGPGCPEIYFSGFYINIDT